MSDIFGIDLQDSAAAITKPKRKLKKPTKLKTKINISRGIRASHIKKLRKELDVNENEFAKLVGKNVAIIRQWESKKGVLKLQSASREVLEKAFNGDITTLGLQST